MTPLPLSIFIITRNEERRLAKTLMAIDGIGDDVVVVDSGSTDRTVEIAQECGARTVINAPFPGYGPQKSYAESLCKHDWVLNLDADEVLTPELREEIRAFFVDRAAAVDAVRIPIFDVLPGERQKPAFGYSVNPIRLYRRSVVGYGDDLVHDRVVTTPQTRIGSFNEIILHYSIDDFSHQIDKLMRYSQLQAVAFNESGRSPGRLRAYFEFFFSFIKYYFLRRYFMRGASGFLASMNYAIYRHVRLIRAIEDPRK